MKGSRERKILGAILALGLVALAADRLLLGGGAPPSAMAAATPGAPEVAPPEVLRAPEPTRFPEVRQHLARIAATHAIDYRAVPAAFTPGPAFAVAEKPLVPASSSRGDEFVHTHRLQGVLVSPGGPTAIVDDTALRLGETLDGARLIAVHQRTAIFDVDSELVTLQLDE